MTGFCDLHLHSACSDGTVAPRDVVALARDAGLDAMALTDHDTFDGVDEALAAGEEFGVRVVTGVELSISHQRTFHLIGLGGDRYHPAFAAAVGKLAGGRPARNREIVAKLNALGMEMTIEEVEAVAGGDIVGRPHIANVMLRRGYVLDNRTAFDEYLGKGASAYANRPRLELAEAFDAVHAAGGATVLCHPFTLGYSAPAGGAQRERFVAELSTMAEAGLDAMEVRYGSYSKPQERYYEEVAREVGLLFCGGSDFHGANKPHLSVGVGMGRMRVPTAWLDALLERGRERRAAAASVTAEAPATAEAPRDPESPGHTG